MSEEQTLYEVEELTTIVSDTGRFAIVPEWVIDADLRPTSVRLYTVLSLMADRKTKTAHPSRRYLAKRCDCSIRTLASALTELKKVGAIKIRHRKVGEGEGLKSEEFDTSIYTVIRADPNAAAPGRAENNPPQAETDTTLGYSNCTENQSHKPEDLSEEEEERRNLLDDLEAAYSNLPVGLSSPLVAPSRWFETLRSNGSKLIEVDLQECVEFAVAVGTNMWGRNGYPQHDRPITFVKPEKLPQLEQAAALWKKYPPKTTLSWLMREYFPGGQEEAHPIPRLQPDNILMVIIENLGVFEHLLQDPTASPSG